MTERRLYLLRHAKSAWDDPGTADRDRPLAPRGERAVTLLHAHVRAAKVAPQLVLCSTARRTVDTLKGVDPGGEVRYEDGLYGASAAELLRRLVQVEDAIERVMIVGHNPALQMLALTLVAPGSHGDLAAIAAKFPTGALATLEFDGPCAGLVPGGARLSDYVRPKALQFS